MDDESLALWVKSSTNGDRWPPPTVTKEMRVMQRMWAERLVRIFSKSAPECHASFVGGAGRSLSLNFLSISVRGDG